MLRRRISPFSDIGGCQHAAGLFRGDAAGGQKPGHLRLRIGAGIALRHLTVHQVAAAAEPSAADGGVQGAQRVGRADM
ncbi:hypothetical protein D3C72_2407070 [compost metagenome]